MSFNYTIDGSFINAKLPVLIVGALSFGLFGCSSQLKYPDRQNQVTSQPNEVKSSAVKRNKCGDIYTVKSGDTLSGIAYRCDVKMRSIAQRNDLLPPYIIYVNQKLTLPYSSSNELARTPKSPKNTVRESVQNKVKDNKLTADKETTKVDSSKAEKTKTEKPVVIAQKVTEVKPKSQPSPKQKAPIKQEQKPLPAKSDNTPTAIKALDSNVKYKNVAWQWPMHKGVAYKYRRDRAGLSVIEIYGIPGQEIAAVAPGKVVYAGNGIANYGWMLVIKHANDFMSIYAHNSALLVREGESVEIGQKIALLGATGDTKRPKLYLEARYKGRKYDIRKKLKR